MRVDTFYGNASHEYTYEARPGLYRIECWGGEGALNGGKGGYVSGFIIFRQNIQLFLYAGGVGKGGKEGEVFNNGGISQYQGGGASDVRLIGGKWDKFESLMSRIIVAGGGGGTDGPMSNLDYGGAAGGTVGFPSKGNYGQPGSQEKGGNGNAKGSFGKGGGNNILGTEGHGGGGGGYFGGGSSSYASDFGGGGGSSYISGYDGCLAIDPSSKSPTEYKMLTTSIHYSEHKFFNSVMIDGKSSMPSPFSTENETGHSSFGVIRITVISYHYSPPILSLCLNKFKMFCLIIFVNKKS